MGEPLRLQFPPKQEATSATPSMPMLGGPATPAPSMVAEAPAPEANGQTKQPKTKKGTGDGDATVARKRTLV